MFVVSVRERGKEEHKFTFRKPEIVIGRLRSNDIILPKRNISKRHAKMEVTDDNRILLVDNGSTNGSYLNGKKILEPTAVGSEDKVFIGDYILQVQFMEEKSAVESISEEPVSMPEVEAMEETGEGVDRPTVADMDDAMLSAELQKLEVESAGDEAGPSTVMVDPMEVPAEAPADLEILDEDVGESTSDNIPAMAEEELEVMPGTQTDSDTLRMREAAHATQEDEFEDSEELIDIPLIEEEEDEESSELIPTPESLEPVPEPAPTRMPPAEAFAPSASRLSLTVSRALDLHYDAIARRFDRWYAGQESQVGPAEVKNRVGELLIDAVGDELGGDLDQVTEQVAAELGYLGAVAALLRDPKIGEVFVASSGQILAWDWRGASADIAASLSCPAACRRLAWRLEQSGSEDAEGLVTARLGDGTLARVLKDPLAADEPCLRFIRPFQTSMSLPKLRDTGVASTDQVGKLEQAVRDGRSILVVGRHTPTLSLVLHSLAAHLPTDDKVLAYGDRFAPGAGLKNFSRFSLQALASHDFATACAAMDIASLVAENLPGDSLATVVELCHILQIPHIVSARLADPGHIADAVGAADNESRTWFHKLLDRAGTLVVDAGKGKIEALYLFVLESGEPKLVPLAG